MSWWLHYHPFHIGRPFLERWWGIFLQFCGFSPTPFEKYMQTSKMGGSNLPNRVSDLKPPSSSLDSPWIFTQPNSACESSLNDFGHAHVLKNWGGYSPGSLTGNHPLKSYPKGKYIVFHSHPFLQGLLLLNLGEVGRLDYHPNLQCVMLLFGPCWQCWDRCTLRVWKLSLWANGGCPYFCAVYIRHFCVPGDSGSTERFAWFWEIILYVYANLIFYNSK